MRVAFQRAKTAGTVAALAVACSVGSAAALEPGAHPPFLAGSTGGVPIGLLPPAGFYVSSLTTYFDYSFHSDNPGGPRNLYSFSEALSILWVPDITLLGARYGAFVQQPFVEKTVTGIPPRGRSSTETGLNNTVISPLNLAWALPGDVFVSARFAFQPAVGQYDRDNLVNIANNFWAFEPNVGITYLRGGVDLSVRLVYDVVTENPSSSARGNVNGRYRSGNIFTGDYTVSQAFGAWRFGVTGFGVQQTNDDSAGGQSLHGTTFSRVAIGPLIQYNTRRIGIDAHYIRDIAWSNTFGGHSFFFRFVVGF